jgi:hypothetical protein
MKLYREKAGVISVNPIYVLLVDGYMYESFTIYGLITKVVKEWKSDRHLIG